MSIDIPSEEQVLQTIIALLNVASQSLPAGQRWDLSDRSFFGLLARADAQFSMLGFRGLEQVDNDAIPLWQRDADGTLISKTSSARLDQYAQMLGLPSGVAGVYGRRGAIGSSGGAGTPTCSIGGTLIPAGTQLQDQSGNVTLEVVDNVTTDGPPNTEEVALRSITTGEAANLTAGQTLVFVAPPVGVSQNMTLTADLVGGQDRESDSELLARILFRYQNPQKGGTAADYRYWAETSVDQANNDQPNGIVRAYVYPLRSGLGTVDVVPTIRGTGTGRKPSSGVITAVQNYLDSVRPITAVVNAIAPSMLASRALRIQVRLKPYPKFPADWNDNQTSTLIGLIDPVAKTIECTMPAALKAQVDLGRNPRIQMIITTTGAAATPYQARVVSYVAGAPDLMTLDEWPAVDPTALTDYFFAGGPYVGDVADNILSYIDSLGPSRQSGTADPFDVWPAEVAIAQIVDVVMDTRDTDGTDMIQNIPDLGTVGVRIAVGGGAFAPVSFTPQDVLATNQVELAFLRRGGIEIIGLPVT